MYDHLDFNTQVNVESINNQLDVEPIKIPEEPLRELYGSKEYEYRPLNQNDIDEVETFTKEELIDNPTLNDGLRAILETRGLGKTAYQLTNEEVYEQFTTAHRGISTSELGLWGETVLARRIANENNLEKLQNLKTGYDIFEKYPDLGDLIDEAREKKDWTKVRSLLGQHAFNILSPSESPMTYAGPAIAGKVVKNIPGMTKVIETGATKAGFPIGKKVATEKIKKLTTKGYISEITLGAGMDGYAQAQLGHWYQHALMDIGYQDEYNPYQTGFAAASAILTGGIQLGLKARKSTNLASFSFDFPNFYTKLQLNAKEKRLARKAISVKAKDVMNRWNEVTKGGATLLEPANGTNHVDFMRTFLDGYKHPTDPSKNIDGMFDLLANKLGVTYIGKLKSLKGSGEFMQHLTFMLNEVIDNDTRKFLARELKKLDTDGKYKKSILAENPISPDGKVKFGKVDNRIKNKDYWSIFLTDMARTANRGGRELGFVGHLAKKVYNNSEEITQKLTEREMLEKYKKGKHFDSYFQTFWKRAVVTNFTTSVYNLAGWTAANGTNLAADTGVLALNLWAMPYKLAYNFTKKKLTGSDMSVLQESFKTSKAIFYNTKERLATMYDPVATIDMYKELLKIDKDTAKLLNQYTNAGVEAGDSITDLAKKMGNVKVENGKIVGHVTPTMHVAEGSLKVARFLNAVDFVDTFTKSQSFIVNLDLAMRMNVKNADGKYIGLKEAASLPKEKINEIFKSKSFFDSMTTATERTQQDILSKSYAYDKDWVLGLQSSDSALLAPAKFFGNGMEFLARNIEEIGNVPILGVYFPFGRFFNNLTAFTYDALGGGSPAAVMELIRTGTIGHHNQRRVMKAFATGGIAIPMMLTEQDILSEEWQDKYAQGFGDPTDTDIENSVTKENFINQLVLDLKEVKEMMSKGDFLGVVKKYNDVAVDTLVRGTTTYSAFSQCVDRDKVKLQQGLQWDEEIYRGKKINIRYHFPLSQCFCAARAYNIRNSISSDGTKSDLGKGMFRDLLEQFAFGSLSRHLTSGTVINNIIADFINDDFDSAESVLMQLLSGVPTNYVSGITRPFQPIGTIVSGSVSDEGANKLTFDNKHSWEAVVFNSARYFNELLGAIGVSRNDKINPVTSISRDTDLEKVKNIYDIGANLSGLKAQAPTTNMEILLAKSGLAVYETEFKTKFPEGDRYIRTLIAPLMNDKAFHLMNREDFIKGSISERGELTKDLIQDVKKDFFKLVETNILNTNIKFKEGDGSTTANLAKRIRQLQKLSSFNIDIRKKAIKSLNEKFNEDSKFKLDPDIKLVDLFEITREDRDFRITNYLNTLLEEAKNIADKGSKKGKFRLGFDGVRRESEGVQIDRYGNQESYN